MSKGGWARLMKQQQQQQESFQCKSADDNEYIQVQKYKNANIYYNTPPASTTYTASSSSSLSATSPPPPPPLQVAVHDQGKIRASRLLQIVKRWKAQSCAKQINTPRTNRSTARSPSCSMLNFVPLSCITFSSIQLHADHEDDDGDDDDDDDDDANEIDIASDSRRKNAKIGATRLHHSPRSAHTMAQLSHQPTAVKNTLCTGKERVSHCERRVREPARRALSCPKLSSPLRTCTTFASTHEEGEERECLQPMKLKRSSSSSPLRRQNMLSKQPSTPKGYLALYVGEERRRFLVKANFLNHPLFSILLEKAKEEFGFNQKGPLSIPCDIAFFQHIMFLVESNHPSLKNADHSSILLHFNSAHHLAASLV